MCFQRFFPQTRHSPDVIAARHVMLRSYTGYCVRIGYCCYYRVSDLHSLGPMGEDATLLALCGVTATVSVSNFLTAQFTPRACLQ